MAAKPDPKKPLPTPCVVGVRTNYNLAEYSYYNVATIEWETSNNRYHARVGFTAPDGHYVFFNSYHDDFTDAEHTINFVREGKANGKLYNIYAETIDVHISPTLGITCEVPSLIYSFVTS
jgi:hypothetical protein